MSGAHRDCFEYRVLLATSGWWALLLKRVFMTDALTCPKCHGRMKILAAITELDAIRKILDHLGIPNEAPRRTAARPPPQA